MNIGSIVEYIDQQKIVSAVILSEKKGKLRLLSENNREVNFSEKRLSHISQLSLDTALSKTALVNHLKQLTEHRKRLSESIDIRELWEILHDESDGIDMDAMTLFCFDPPLTPDTAWVRPTSSICLPSITWPITVICCSSFLSSGVSRSR